MMQQSNLSWQLNKNNASRKINASSQRGERRCPQTKIRLSQFSIILVLEMNCWWEVSSIPMTTSVSSVTSLTSYSISVRGNHLLNNEWWLFLLCVLSLWHYVCITVFWEIAEYYQKRSRKFSSVFFICLFTSLLTFMCKIHPSSPLAQASRHHAAWMCLLHSHTFHRIGCSDTCAVTGLLFCAA